MLGNRNSFEDTGNSTTSDSDIRIQIETLRYFRENDEEMFEDLKQDLKGTFLWQKFQQEYD